MRPETPKALVCVLLRARRLGGASPGAGAGYYCGVDRRGARLLLARTTGSDIGDGTMHLFADPFATPGKILSTGVRLDQPYTVTLRVKGSALSCEVVLPNTSRVELTATDTNIARGGIGLYSVGAKAQFERLKACGPN